MTSRASHPYILATVVEILGSSSAKPAAKALIDLSGKVIAGWVGGGCAQSMVSEAALKCLETGEPRVIRMQELNDEVFGAGMPCGGSMRGVYRTHLAKSGALANGPRAHRRKSL